MSQAMSSAGQKSNGFKGYLLEAYHFAASNLSLVTMLLGVLVIAFGGFVVTQYHDILGPMVAIFGATLLLVGGIAYAVLLANKLIARLTE